MYEEIRQQKLICITNRHLVQGDFLDRIRQIAAKKQVDAIIASGYVPVAHTPLFEGVRVADAAHGLLAAATKKAGEVMPAHALEALYLRKSSAEEGR